MKSEERHQLLTNDLGVVTNRTVGFLERHGTAILLVVAVVVILSGVGFIWSRGNDAENAAGWTMLGGSRTVQDFESVALKFKGKPPGQWARLQVAERTLQNAIPLMFSNRELAVGDLKSAREDFELLLKERKLDPMIRERAMWGMALALETMCDGDTSKPIEAYERLIAEYPETIFKAIADERMIALKRKDAAEFYAWFSKENPKPPDVRPRDPGVGGLFDNVTPGGNTPAGDAAKPEAPAAGGSQLPDALQPENQSGQSDAK